MKTKGINEILIETHNWGSTVAFWQDLGYQLEFETDHHSGRLRHPSGGPSIFVAERPHDHTLQVVLGVAVADAAQFTTPRSGTVVRPFEKQHWPALQMLLADPDGRQLAVEAAIVVNKEARGKETAGKNVRHTAGEGGFGSLCSSADLRSCDGQSLMTMNVALNREPQNLSRIQKRIVGDRKQSVGVYSRLSLAAFADTTAFIGPNPALARADRS